MLLSLLFSITALHAQSLSHDPGLIDLELKRAQEIAEIPGGYFGVTSSKIAERFNILNEETFTRVEKEPLVSRSHRVDGVTVEQAMQVLESIGRNPVASKMGLVNYAREGVDIGYCFGRAVYYHLMFLKLGVNPDSIRKIWVLGEIPQNRIQWGHHVAIMVRGTKPGEWLVLDTFVGKVRSARSWFHEMKRHTRDPKLRVYTTEASKFSLNLGTYDPIQMGLRLPKEVDWYRGFFPDLFRSIRESGTAEIPRFERPARACAKVHG